MKMAKRREKGEEKEEIDHGELDKSYEEVKVRT